MLATGSFDDPKIEDFVSWYFASVDTCLHLSSFVTRCKQVELHCTDFFAPARFQAIYLPSDYQCLMFGRMMRSYQTVAQSSCSHCSVVLVEHVGVLGKPQAAILDAVFEVLLFALRQLLDCSAPFVEEMFPMDFAHFLMMWNLSE